MTPVQIQLVQECVRMSASGQIGFGEVVGRLINADIERYHADYSRAESTFYSSDGGSCVVAMEIEIPPIAPSFDAALVQHAVRQAQRGEIRYKQFSDQAVAAGCVGYFVQITGKRVQYFGRRGESHTEWFPGAGPDRE